MSNEKRSIPLIDLSPWTAPEKSSQSDRDAVVGQVATACREIGFFAVMNHGVDASVMDAAWAASQQFFDLATAVKLESKTVDTAAYPYGYECNERLSAGKSSDKKGADDDDDGDVDTDSAPLDLKETFAIGPSNPAAGMPPRQIPAQPAVLATALNDYYAAMEDLALQLLDIFAIALELPKDYFRVRCDKHLSALRILNYFAMDKAPSPTEEPLIRAGAHTDYGALTILRSGGPGLQVKKDVIGIGDEETQDFADVPHLDNSYIINLGDMMQRWTNDRWVSTLHRVVVPNNGLPVERRQSMAYFVNVNGDALIEPLPACVTTDSPSKYPPITAKEHVMSKHLASMGIKA